MRFKFFKWKKKKNKNTWTRVKKNEQTIRRKSLLFSVFLFLFLFDLAVLFNIWSFLLSSFFFIDLISFFQSFFSSWINIFPHFADDFGQFGDWDTWVLWFNFVIDFFSEEEESRKGSFWWSGLNKYKFTLSSTVFLPIKYQLNINF